jgi:hypothetical protein
MIGFGLLVNVPQEPDSQTISTLILVGYVIVFVFVAQEATFHMRVTTWAVGETARSSAVPSFYGPLRQWISWYGQAVYVIVGLLALAAFGWGFTHRTHSRLGGFDRYRLGRLLADRFCLPASDDTSSIAHYAHGNRLRVVVVAKMILNMAAGLPLYFYMRLQT